MKRIPCLVLFVLGIASMIVAEDPWWKKLPRPSWGRFDQVKQSQDWFEVYEVRPDVFAIYESGQWEEVISYLIVGSEKAVLFDTGLGIGDLKKLTSEITSLQPIVINSHTHIDHVGGNYQFQQIYGTDTDFTLANAKGKSHEDVMEILAEGAVWKPLPSGFSPEKYVSHPFSITKAIHHGEKLDLGGRTLEILFTPGHTPDSVCLLDRKNRLLFTGDTFYPAPIYVNTPGSDFSQFVKSVAYLAELQEDVDFLLTGHNETLLASDYLSRLKQASIAIESNKAQFVNKDQFREYQFDGFSILTKPALDQ
jgi:glyoxylase-like metal-dependent hydrolase (beta-lactamase superfamily II)